MIRLDLADIQGNIHRAYGRFGFPHMRHLFFNIADAQGGRDFVDGARGWVTSAAPWAPAEGPAAPGLAKKPKIAVNIGFTYLGLRALCLPTRTLSRLPDEFTDGMARRANILGDWGDSAPEHWDKAWHYNAHEPAGQVHVWISLNSPGGPDGRPTPDLDAWTKVFMDLAAHCGGVTPLGGHGADGLAAWQDSSARMEAGPDGAMHPTAKEYFGFTDGISDPVFNGQFDKAEDSLQAVGGGKIAEGVFSERTSWSPLETGEFLLGHADEGQEFPVATHPAGFARNGTFVAYRKLEENVAAFDADMRRQADVWMKVTGETDPMIALETVQAKVCGRWTSGIPLMAAPTWADHLNVLKEWADAFAIMARRPKTLAERRRLNDLEKMLTGFRYGDDPDGKICPLGAHMRRANPRDMLDPKADKTHGASTLVNRRRILRRGLPYQDANGDKGVIFLAVCASLFRQFEFIQQQWMNYGLDFDAGNDGCPMIGNRPRPGPAAEADGSMAASKHVIPAGPANAVPVIAADLPQFVTTKGGDYFFLPSLTALRMIAMGTIDPT